MAKEMRTAEWSEFKKSPLGQMLKKTIEEYETTFSDDLDPIELARRNLAMIGTNYFRAVMLRQQGVCIPNSLVDDLMVDLDFAAAEMIDLLVERQRKRREMEEDVGCAVRTND